MAAILYRPSFVNIHIFPSRITMAFSIDICNMALLPQNPSVAVIAAGAVLLMLLLATVSCNLHIIYWRCPTVDAYMILLGNMSTGILVHAFLLLSVKLISWLPITELVASIVLVLAEHLLALPVLGSLILIHVKRCSFICNGIAYSHRFWRLVAIVGAIIPWALAIAAASLTVLFSNGNCWSTHVISVGVVIASLLALVVTNSCIQKTNRRLLHFDMHLHLQQHAWIGRHGVQVNTVCQQQVLQPFPKSSNRQGGNHSVCSIPRVQRSISTCSIDCPMGSSVNIHARSGSMQLDGFVGHGSVRSPAEWSIHTTISGPRRHTRHSIEHVVSPIGLSIQINSLKSPGSSILDTHSVNTCQFIYPEPSIHDDSDGVIWDTSSMKSLKYTNDKLHKTQRPGRVFGVNEQVNRHATKTYSQFRAHSATNLSVIESTGEYTSADESCPASVLRGMNVSRRCSRMKDSVGEDGLRQPGNSNCTKQLLQRSPGSTHPYRCAEPGLIFGNPSSLCNKDLAVEYSRYGPDIATEISYGQKRQALPTHKDQSLLETSTVPVNWQNKSEAGKATRHLSVYDFLKEDVMENNHMSNGNGINAQGPHSIGNESQINELNNGNKFSSLADLSNVEGPIPEDKDTSDHDTIAHSFRRTLYGYARVCLAIVLCLLQGLPGLTSMITLDSQLLVILTPIIGIAHVLYYVRAHRSLFQTWKHCFGIADNVINVLPLQNKERFWGKDWQSWVWLWYIYFVSLFNDNSHEASNTSE